MSLRYIIISCLLLLSYVSNGQDPIVVDEIIAKVDNYIILKSDLETRFLEARSQGAREPENQLRCLIACRGTDDDRVKPVAGDGDVATRRNVLEGASVE